jgi:nitrate/nitrite transporter NarK
MNDMQTIGKIYTTLTAILLLISCVSNFVWLIWLSVGMCMVASILSLLQRHKHQLLINIVIACGICIRLYFG